MKHDSTVFVIDDDPVLLRSLESLIRVVFPRVEAFASADEFLATYRPDRPGCMVLDVAMPGMSGMELHERMAEQQIDLPVIFITGHATVRMAVGAMRAGAVNFLEKPFRDQELWDSIRRALEMDARRRQVRTRRETTLRRLTGLSPGEREVLDLVLAGKLNKEIASQLDVSVRTVEDRRSRLMKKMQAESVVELVQMVLDVVPGGPPRRSSSSAGR